MTDMEMTVRKVPELDDFCTELAAWLREGNPFSGFLIMISDDEFNEIYRKVYSKNSLDVEYSSLITMLFHFKGDIRIGKEFNTETFSVDVNKCLTSIDLEHLRRIGAIKLVSKGPNEDEWTWTKAEINE